MIFNGSKLRKLRETLGWSAYDVERKTGVRQSVISDLENGKTNNPRPETVKRLCQGLKVNDEFFYIEDVGFSIDLLPDMPTETLIFIMSGESVPYLVVSEYAKRHGITADTLKQLIDILIANRKP